MKPYIEDSDLTIYCGDALEVLRSLPDGSVDCCVTSPPYWGLRDYGTGQWDGGDPDCDHAGPPKASDKSGLKNDGRPAQLVGQNDYERAATVPFRDVCGKCGARRVDRQLGLEPSPDEYVAAMVAVFAEVRRVLADHGTLWLNIGDSYAAQGGGKAEGQYEEKRVSGATYQFPRTPPNGLKPKDLVGIPWMLAFALRADGWYLRSEIIWAKPNPMPESVTDRPTKTHEQVFLFAKKPRYYFDQEAVREKYADPEREWWNEPVGDGHLADADRPRPKGGWGDGGVVTSRPARGPDGRRVTTVKGADGSLQHRDGERWPNGGRNIRSVWDMATQPFPGAHFAVFPEELPRRCIEAGCPMAVCVACGKPRERLLEKQAHGRVRDRAGGGLGTEIRRETHGLAPVDGTFQEGVSYETVGWSDCGCGAGFRPGVVLDPFGGSGTTGLVARKFGRRAVLIELSPEYARLAAERTQQLSLLA